jgi:hypothetical protein
MNLPTNSAFSVCIRKIFAASISSRALSAAGALSVLKRGRGIGAAVLV